MKASFVNARKRAKLTQSEVAKYVGVRQSTVSWWESGRGTPRIKTLSALARLYGCSVNDLLGKRAAGSAKGGRV